MLPLLDLMCYIGEIKFMDDLTYSDSASSKKRLSKRLLFFLLFFVVVLLLLGGLFYFLSQGSKEEPKTISLDQTPTVTEEVSETPTPTEIDRSEIDLAVQNGSGVAGAAGKIADSLKKLGYNITSTGNADNFDYEDITIQVKKGQEDLLSALQEDLSKEFTVGSSSATLSANLTYDALIIVGK